MYFCVLSLAFNWSPSLFRSIETCCSNDSLLSISISRSFKLLSELIIRSLIFFIFATHFRIHNYFVQFEPLASGLTFCFKGDSKVFNSSFSCTYSIDMSNIWRVCFCFYKVLDLGELQIKALKICFEYCWFLRLDSFC